jgi:hypothetical protein
MVIDQRKAKLVALGLAALGGGALGFFVGRGSVSHSEALATLSDALATQQRVSSSAPIIAASITAASAIVGSCLSCCSVWWIIHWTAQKEESP